MRVLQLVTKRQLRGAEVFAAVLSEELQKRNVSVYFLGIYKNKSAEVLNPKVHHIGDLGDGNFFSKLRQLISIVDSFQPHIIQANGSVTLKFALGAKFISSHKVKVVYRNISIISAWMKNPFKRIFYTALFRKADKVVSVSDASRKDFIKTLSFPKDKIITLRRGISVPSQLPFKSPLTNDACYLLHVGSFTPEKNHIGLLNIVRVIFEAFPSMKLICLGEGEGRQDIERKIAALQLTGKVLLEGYKKNTESYYRNASILLMTSTIEGIPGVVLEAAAQGTPAVAFEVGGMAEAIQDSVTGYLIAPGDNATFCNKTISLLRDTQLTEDMGKKAYEYVKHNFNRDNVSDKFFKVYTEIIGKEN